MGICKPDDTDKEITKTSLKTGTVPLQTQVSAVNPVITQKSYEVLSIDKHEEFWNISLREAVTKKLSIGRLVLSAIEDDSQDLRQQLTDAFSIDKTLKLEVTDAAKDLIIDRGYDPIYGARPLKRCLQSGAETLIAKEILRGDLPAGSTLVLDAENGQLTCRPR